MTRMTIDKAHERCGVCDLLAQAIITELDYHGTAGPRTTAVYEGPKNHVVTVTRGSGQTTV